MSPRARTARPAAAPVAFRGPPHRLSSLVQLPDAPDALGEPRALLEGAEIRGLGVRALTREGPGVGKLTLRLPKSTPPGTYSGSVELAESHGGLVEVRARTKSRTIAPGQSGDVQLTLRFSDRLRPGGRYAGAWDADGLHVRVGVTVPSKGRRR